MAALYARSDAGNNSPTPVPCSAEIVIRSAKSRNGSRRSRSSRTFFRCSGDSPSHLLVTTTSALPRSSTSPNGLQCLDDTELLDRLADARLAPDSRRIDQHVLAIIALERNLDGIASRPRQIVDDQPLLTEQAIRQRRFADVGSTDDGNPEFVFVVGLGRLRIRLESGQDAVHQRVDTIAVRRRDGYRLAEAQAVEICARGDGIESLGLVDGQPGLPCVAPCQLGNVFVGRRDAAAPVDHNDRHVGFLQRLDGLFDHGFVDTLFAAGYAAGIDHEVGNRPQFAKTVFAVACQAGVIGHERVAGTR